jgi:hypothetical protein
MNGFITVDISNKDAYNHPLHGKIFYLQDTFDCDTHGVRLTYVELKANKELFSSA